jgi:CheY-like chemotaxis protein
MARVLVVDDHIDNARTLTALVRHLGHDSFAIVLFKPVKIEELVAVLGPA